MSKYNSPDPIPDALLGGFHLTPKQLAVLKKPSPPPYWLVTLGEEVSLLIKRYLYIDHLTRQKIANKFKIKVAVVHDIANDNRLPPWIGIPGWEKAVGWSQGVVTSLDAKHIRLFHAEGVKLVDLMYCFGVSNQYIREILQGQVHKRAGGEILQSQLARTRSTLTATQVAAIRASDQSESWLATQYKVSRSTIYRIRTYKTHVLKNPPDKEA